MSQTELHPPALVTGIPPTTASGQRADNLSTMLFVAAVFHGVLILGVSFTSGGFNEDAESESMEVVILNREFEERPDSPDAEYLAQQNLVGSGNTTADEALRVAYGRDNNPVAPGPERDGLDKRREASSTQTPSQQMLYAISPNADAMTEQKERAEDYSAPLRTGMTGMNNNIEILATPDEMTVLKGAQPRQLLISANTRESRIASYLDGWKRRVERVGTINFPYEALQDPDIRDPILEVSIAASGKLTDVIIVRSSGNRELDMAAVNILKMAAPFDRFPDFLRNDYDSLKFSYEWQFTANSVGRMTVP